MDTFKINWKDFEYSSISEDSMDDPYDIRDIVHLGSSEEINQLISQSNTSTYADITLKTDKLDNNRKICMISDKDSAMRFVQSHLFSFYKHIRMR